MPNLFVYGTLLFPEMVKALTGNVFRTSTGILDGYRRFGVPGAAYPGIVRQGGSRAEGLILHEVDATSLELLRFYEGEEYELQTAELMTPNGRIEAVLFVWKGNPGALKADWDEQQFAENLLDEYVQKIAPATVEEFRRSGFS